MDYAIEYLTCSEVSLIVVNVITGISFSMNISIFHFLTTSLSYDHTWLRIYNYESVSSLAKYGMTN